MFDGQSIIAQVRAGVIASKWLVIPATRAFLLRRFTGTMFNTLLLGGIFVFAAIGGINLHLWSISIVSILIGIGVLWYFRTPFLQAYQDLATWKQQYAVFTPEGFLVASSAAIKPRITMAYEDIQEMHIFRTASSAGGNGIDFALATSHLRVTYQDQSIKTFTLDHRFGPEERLWNICIAAHHWYITHDEVVEDA